MSPVSQYQLLQMREVTGAHIERTYHVSLTCHLARQTRVRWNLSTTTLPLQHLNFIWTCSPWR